jgi:hypothetical protein
MVKMTRDKRLRILATHLGVVSLLFCVLSIGRARALQSQGDCAPAKPTPAPSYDSFFGRQDPIEAESPEWRISLAKTEPSPECGDRFLFQVREKGSGAITQFEICDVWTKQIDEVDVVNKTRALILGRAGPDFVRATVVDLPAGKVVDRFPSFRPTLSPRHRFLAFIMDFPPHPGAVEISDEYIVYDLTRSADFNRVNLEPGVGYNAGWPVYPPGGTNAVGENVLPAGSPHHERSSRGLFWLDDDTLAFSDFFQGQDLLVVANFSSGVRDAKVRTLALDPAQLVDLDQCQKSTAPSDFEVWSKEPVGLIKVAQMDLVPGKPGMACLHFVLSPCLRQADLMVKLP